MDMKQWKAIKKDVDDIVLRYRNVFSEDGLVEGVYALLWETRAWAYFVKCGAELIGYSVRHKDDEWLLVSKATLDGTQVVAFMSGATTTSCMRKMLHRLEEGNVRFYPDKFA